MDGKILIFVVFYLSTLSLLVQGQVTEKIASATEASTTKPSVTSTTAPLSSSGVTSSVSENPIVVSSNPQDKRDTGLPFIDTTGECFTTYQKMGQNAKDNLRPERVILNAPADSLSPVTYCQQQTLIKKLNETCSAANLMKDGDKAMAGLSQGYTAMFNFVCATNSTALDVLPDKTTKCMPKLMEATKKCAGDFNNSPATLVSGQYPSEMMSNMLMYPVFDCTTLKMAKGCIAKEIAGTSCSEEQQKAILALLDPIMTVPCTSAISTDTTVNPAGSATTIPAGQTTFATTTGAPSTTPRSRNSASHFNSNLFIAILPVLLFAFY